MFGTDSGHRGSQHSAAEDLRERALQSSFGKGQTVGLCVGCCGWGSESVHGSASSNKFSNCKHSLYFLTAPLVSQSSQFLGCLGPHGVTRLFSVPALLSTVLPGCQPVPWGCSPPEGGPGLRVTLFALSGLLGQHPPGPSGHSGASVVTLASLGGCSWGLSPGHCAAQSRRGGNLTH